MESRFQYIFLMSASIIRHFFAALVVLTALTSVNLFAQEFDEEPEDDELGQIITPDIDRRSIKEAMINTEHFEIGSYYGLLSIEDFGSNEVVGISVAYHITEDFFVEAVYGMSQTEKTSYELLSGGVELLTDEERDLTYYNMSLGYNLLPGQIYISDKWAFNTRIYLIAGVGNTQFASKEYFTYNFGAGLRFFATDWVSFDLSMRDHVFSHELFGETKDAHNLEGRFGLSLFF